MLPANNSDVEI